MFFQDARKDLLSFGRLTTPLPMFLITGYCATKQVLHVALYIHQVILVFIGSHHIISKAGPKNQKFKLVQIKKLTKVIQIIKIM